MRHPVFALLAFLCACGGGSDRPRVDAVAVSASVATEPCGDPDDMAVWIDPVDRAKSVILVCDKQELCEKITYQHA